MILFLIITTVIAALSSWGFAIASVSAYQNGDKKTGFFFSVVSFVLGVGGILIWLFL